MNRMAKIPKYVLRAISARSRAAEQFLKYEGIISNWCDKKGIMHDVEYILSHIVTLAEPWVAEIETPKQIIAALEKRENNER